MLKYVPQPIRLHHLRLTWGELLLLVGAVALAIGALVKLGQSPVVSSVMLLASAALVALVYERVSTRRTLVALAEHLTAGPLNKLEIEPGGSARVLGQALNQAIQRTRSAAPPPAQEPVVTAEPLPVAVLSIGLRQHGPATYSAAYGERLAEVALAARRASHATDALLDAYGDGTLLLIFGAQTTQALAASTRLALEVARVLASGYPDLRFGLGCGEGRLCALPGIGTTVIGAPIEDAVRLFRMAAAWHEYRLLCAEPIALLAQSFPSQRTPLQLTHATLPPLPIYALSLDTATVAMSA